MRWHTSLATATRRPYSRLISAEHARLMAGVGGVIGVWPAGFAFVDARDWVSGIARLVDVAGVDHVGIGTDMEGGVSEVSWSAATTCASSGRRRRRGRRRHERDAGRSSR
ncbi:MAG TPA: hypothetical protein VK878_07240 [Candidatus Deferrimicrobiaceae bacterium]|nr:hypothetical protein [Candidatus Deferrimicrobiaceae bacterium]